jgi:hypothetical protein
MGAQASQQAQCNETNWRQVIQQINTDKEQTNAPQETDKIFE